MTYCVDGLRHTLVKANLYPLLKSFCSRPFADIVVLMHPAPGVGLNRRPATRNIDGHEPAAFTSGTPATLQNCARCRPKEHFWLKLFKAILFPMIDVAANLPLPDGNKIT